MHFTAHFECGNIDVVSVGRNQAKLKIRRDPDPEYLQWFYFQCITTRGDRCSFDIINAGECSFKDAWKDCFIVASYDGDMWFRLPTLYDGVNLRFSIELEHPSIYFATFAPYTSVRRQRLISRCQSDEFLKAGLTVYGESVEKRPLQCLQIGKGDKPVWITAAQHPGEPMAEWCVEGMIDRLVDRHDATTRALLDKARLHIVPNVNPDGSFHGYIRTNAAGVDLNRSWQSDTVQKSPEIFYLKNEMEKTGVDIFLDIHGDENIPHVFFSNTDGVPSMTAERIARREKFEEALAAVNPDFEPGHGYPTDMPGKADLSIGSNFVAECYPCLSVTLEQPFRDDKDNEQGYRGWSPERSKRLGASLLTAVYAVL